MHTFVRSSCLTESFVKFPRTLEPINFHRHHTGLGTANIAANTFLSPHSPGYSIMAGPVVQVFSADKTAYVLFPCWFPSLF